MTIGIDAKSGDRIVDRGLAIFFRYGKITVSGMKKGEQPSKPKVAETHSATDPVPLTMDLMDINIPADAESVEIEGIDLDSTIEESAVDMLLSISEGEVQLYAEDQPSVTTKQKKMVTNVNIHHAKGGIRRHHANVYETTNGTGHQEPWRRYVKDLSREYSLFF